MSTITDKVIETPTIVNIMEKYIELIRKEALYFPECFNNLCIYKNSMDHDITQTSISVRIGGSKDYVVLGLERTDNDTIWQSIFSNGHLAKQYKLKYHEPDNLEDIIAFVFGILVYNNTHKQYNDYIKKTSLKDNLLFKHMMDYREKNKVVSHPVSINNAILLLDKYHKP